MLSTSDLLDLNPLDLLTQIDGSHVIPVENLRNIAEALCIGIDDAGINRYQLVMIDRANKERAIPIGRPCREIDVRRLLVFTLHSFTNGLDLD